MVMVTTADAAYGGKLVIRAKKYLDITIKTVRRPPDAKGFVVVPRRWVVERSSRRKNRPAERRDAAHGYVMPKAACPFGRR